MTFVNDFYLILLFIFVCIFIHLFMLVFEFKHIEKSKFYVLLGFVFLELFMLVFQYYFCKIEIMGSGFILLLVYFYLVMAIKDRERIDILTLERNYAMKNLIDKQSFLRKLSYEMRVPIGTIDGFSQMMEDSKDINEVKEDAKDVRLASRELIDLINSMIDLSIIESGELEILKENYNVYNIFDDLEKMIVSRLRNGNVKFIFNISKDIPCVLLGDSDRLRQVVLNVISNSIKYTEKGGIKLGVSSVKSDSICRLLIKVVDTGKGMSKEEIIHLFDDNNEEEGIGLKVASHLIKLMNGNIDISSEVGKGTVVSISIDQEIISVKDDKRRRKKEVTPFSLKGKRVLLVDDNRLNLKVARKLLSLYELEIVDVGSGKECLDILDKDHNFDLILMDDLMPEMSGTETLDVLRKIERVDGYYIPVVVLTANATVGMKEKYLNSGFDDYLSKPIDREELDRVIREFLK